MNCLFRTQTPGNLGKIRCANKGNFMAACTYIPSVFSPIFFFKIAFDSHIGAVLYVYLTTTIPVYGAKRRINLKTHTPNDLKTHTLKVH